MEIVTYNQKDLEKIKILYNEALEKKAESFEYNGNKYLVGYAKYLIEYLEGNFK